MGYGSRRDSRCSVNYRRLGGSLAGASQIDTRRNAFTRAVPADFLRGFTKSTFDTARPAKKNSRLSSKIAPRCISFRFASLTLNERARGCGDSSSFRRKTGGPFGGPRFTAGVVSYSGNQTLCGVRHQAMRAQVVAESLPPVSRGETGFEVARCSPVRRFDDDATYETEYIAGSQSGRAGGVYFHLMSARAETRSRAQTGAGIGVGGNACAADEWWSGQIRQRPDLTAARRRTKCLQGKGPQRASYSKMASGIQRRKFSARVSEAGCVLIHSGGRWPSPIRPILSHSCGAWRGS